MSHYIRSQALRLVATQGPEGGAMDQDSKGPPAFLWNHSCKVDPQVSLWVAGLLWKEKANSQKRQALHLQVHEIITQRRAALTCISSALLSPPYSGIFPQFKQKKAQKRKVWIEGKNWNLLSHMTWPYGVSFISLVFIYRQHYIEIIYLNIFIPVDLTW